MHVRFPAGRKSGQQGLGASRLPVFSPQEKSYIKGTCDFLGLGHFTTRYVTLKNYPSGLGDSYFADRDLAELVDPQWPDPGSEWLYSVPWGFRRLLNFVKVHDPNLNKINLDLVAFSGMVADCNQRLYKTCKTLNKVSTTATILPSWQSLNPSNSWLIQKWAKRLSKDLLEYN